MREDRRPWGVNPDNWDRVMRLFPTWLQDRGGIVVYENENFNSRAFGDRAFVPAMMQVEGEDDLRAAPKRIGTLPSNFKEKVDQVTLEEFGGDVDLAIESCFRRRRDDD